MKFYQLYKKINEKFRRYPVGLISFNWLKIINKKHEIFV